MPHKFLIEQRAFLEVVLDFVCQRTAVTVLENQAVLTEALQVLILNQMIEIFAIAVPTDLEERLDLSPGSFLISITGENAFLDV